MLSAALSATLEKSEMTKKTDDRGRSSLLDYLLFTHAA